MRVAILFNHIGHYHIARLRAANQVCQQNGWQLTAIQATDKTSDHPWGDLLGKEPFALKTLLSASDAKSESIHPDSPQVAAQLAPCLDELSPDVVVIPGWGFPVSRAAIKWCSRHNIPAILMSESKWDDEPRSWWKEQLKSWLYVRKFAAAIVGSPAHKNYLMQLGVDSHRIFFGYDVVDNQYFTEQAAIARSQPTLARQQQPLLPHKPYFLSVTRLLPRKNMLRQVQAYAEYVSRVGNTQAWPLVICGSGAEMNNIQQLIADNNLTDLVQFPGFLTYQQIGAWYGLAGAFIHAALIEQWGLVVNEACAAGLPILCSRSVGACSTLVEQGSNGIVFDPKQMTEIADAMVTMHQLSQSDRLAMGAHSQELANRCSPDQFGKGILQAIQIALPQYHPSHCDRSSAQFAKSSH